MAEAERSMAFAREKLHLYGATLLTAVGEVEDALVNEKEAAIEKAKADLITKEKLLSSRQKTLNEHVSKIRQYESDKKIKKSCSAFDHADLRLPVGTAGPGRTDECHCEGRRCVDYYIRKSH